MNTFAHLCDVNELVNIDGSMYVLKACLLHQNTDFAPNPKSGHCVAIARHEGGFHKYWLYDDSTCKNMSLTTWKQWTHQNHFRAYACLYEQAKAETPPLYEPGSGAGAGGAEAPAGSKGAPPVRPLCEPEGGAKAGDTKTTAKPKTHLLKVLLPLAHPALNLQTRNKTVLKNYMAETGSCLNKR